MIIGGYKRWTFHWGEKLLTLVSRVCLVEALICVLSAVGAVDIQNVVVRGFGGYWATVSSVICGKREEEQAVRSAFLFWVAHLFTVAPSHPHIALFLWYNYILQSIFLVANQRFVRSSHLFHNIFLRVFSSFSFLRHMFCHKACKWTERVLFVSNIASPRLWEIWFILDFW